MENFDEKYALTGKLLVAAPVLNDDDIFGRSVVYICSHSNRGAMGVIINKPLEKFTFFGRFRTV